MKKFILLNFYILLFLTSFSQKGIKDNTPKLLSEKPEKYIFETKFEYNALKYKKELIENPDDTDVNFKLGYCLLNSSKERFNSIAYFRKALLMHDDKKSEIPFVAAYYYLGRALYLSYKFDEAIETFEKLLLIVERKKVILKVNRQLELCRNAKKTFDNPTETAVSKLGVINSEYLDHSPIMSADESVIYFTSTRKDNAGNYMEDIYSFNKKDGIHAFPENTGTPINTELHDATCGISVSGQELFLYRPTGGGDIYYSKLSGTKWETPEKLSKNINTSKRETQASLSADGKYLYFASNRKGGYGGLDIYVCKKEKDGTWGKAKNLGKNINTKYDEESPCIHPDEQTLYFSSKGHGSMGGYDIFYSKLKKAGSWLEPKSMGYPINSVDNDLYYFPSADGLKGYYTQSRGNIANIYSATNYTGQKKVLAIISGKAIDLKADEKEINVSDCKIAGDTLTLSSGRIIVNNGLQEQGDSVVITYKEIMDDIIYLTDSIYHVARNTQIYIIDIETGELVNNFSPNSVTGEYLFVLKVGKDYKIYFDADNHIFDTENISLTADSTFIICNYSAKLDTLEKGKIQKSKEMPFEEEKTVLNKFTRLELDLLVYFLKENTELLVNFSGYDYLLENSDPNFLPPSFKLVKPRTDSIINYIEKKGIAKERIYRDLSANMIFGDVIEYTIFDEITLKKAQDLKKDRLAVYMEAFAAANIAEEDLVKEYGVETDNGKETVIVSDMLFDINKFNTYKYTENLKILATYLKENKTAIIEVGGYTDLQGPVSFNEQLSRKRADFIRKNLLKKGVNSKQVKVKHYSSQNPISRNKMSNGKFDFKALVYNRRVEIKVLKQGENKNLKISKIEVPKEFKVGIGFDAGAFSYSINVLTIDSPISFDGILDDVKEHKDSDGSYIYYYGSYETEEEAQEFLELLRADFPDAFVFIKDF